MRQSKILALFLAFSFLMAFSGIAQQQAQETVTCPVSGKEIKKSEAKATYEYEGKTYYFCCEKCKEEFVKNPEKYTQKKAEMKEVYTCPMHSDVKADKPGKCPKCGMKLEKKMMKMEHKLACPKKMEKAKHAECCAMMGLMKAKDIDVDVENLENGVAVKITSKNADVVKKIQQFAVKMKEKCKEKTECKKEAKKEEVKK